MVNLSRCRPTRAESRPKTSFPTKA